MSEKKSEPKPAQSKWAKEAVHRIKKNGSLTMADIEEIEKLLKHPSTAMDPPAGIKLPLFVYGALKPGLPGFESLRQFVDSKAEDAASGELLVRDGLPLLRKNDESIVEGWLLIWKNGHEQDAYDVVCAFEPRKHYTWDIVTLQSGRQANVLVILYPEKGSPEPLYSRVWNLADDSAFGAGLDEVERVLEEVDQIPGGRDDFDVNLRRFFRAQMGYLLLWSVLERLSAFCFGPSLDPMERINRLHELPGMAKAVATHIERESRVSDARNPGTTYRLDAQNAKMSFKYYYQIRSNLTHRGKGVFNEFDLVRSSLRELLGITRAFLASLQSIEDSPAIPIEFATQDIPKHGKP